MFEVDLHLHTTYSDGTLDPAELVSLCASRGLSVIAISDHDSTEALPEALAAARGYDGLKVIPAIELSTDIPGSEIHILGYYVDYQDRTFQKVLGDFRQDREGRGRRIVEKLNGLGLKISWERVKQISDGGAIGRPHIAQALVEAGYVQYPRDAFDRFIGRDGPAYVGRAKLTPADAIKLLIENGALPVMAHPTYAETKSDSHEVPSLKEIVADLKHSGLVGIEVFYGNYTPDQVSYLFDIATEFNLVPCGGSDYHASGNPDEPEPGTVGPPLSTARQLADIKQMSDSLRTPS